MRKASAQIWELSILHLLLIGMFIIGCTQQRTDIKIDSDNFLLIKGGTFSNTNSMLYRKGAEISDFFMAKYEVTQREWDEIMGNNPSKYRGDSLPVETVSWYDCIEFCNKKSLKEGLNPYYNIDKNSIDPNNRNELDSIKWTVTINLDSDGYRLPTEVEWEYAASGGQQSKNFKYSGGDNLGEVAWYWRNSGDELIEGSWHWMTIEGNNCQTHPVGLKKPNELGLYDMSGNVREWCEEWYQDQEFSIGIKRVQRGGGWVGGELRCEFSNRHHFDANGKGPDQGLRLCRSVVSG